MFVKKINKYYANFTNVHKSGFFLIQMLHFLAQLGVSSVVPWQNDVLGNNQIQNLPVVQGKTLKDH